MPDERISIGLLPAIASYAAGMLIFYLSPYLIAALATDAAIRALVDPDMLVAGQIFLASVATVFVPRLVLSRWSTGKIARLALLILTGTWFIAAEIGSAEVRLLALALAAPASGVVVACVVSAISERPDAEGSIGLMIGCSLGVIALCSWGAPKVGGASALPPLALILAGVALVALATGWSAAWPDSRTGGADAPDRAASLEVCHHHRDATDNGSRSDPPQ